MNLLTLNLQKVEDYQIQDLYKKVVKDVRLYPRKVTDIEGYLSNFIDKKD